MDLPFLQSFTCRHCKEVIKVSILVLMDLPFLRSSWGLISHFYSSVSILVLMDLPFLQKERKPLCRCWTGFNPWSYGSSVLTYYAQALICKLCNMFQSLFLWIFRSYKQAQEMIKDLEKRFNPCSYGSSVLTNKKEVVQEALQEFQSLFLWIFRSYEHVER